MDSNEFPKTINTAHTEQPVELSYPVIVPEVQQVLAEGSIAVITILCLAVLVHQIRLLVEASKS